MKIKWMKINIQFTNVSANQIERTGNAYLNILLDGELPHSEYKTDIYILGRSRV